jgi:HTH-type transcriptional regulator, sugar sensing transcriptional regulator
MVDNIIDRLIEIGFSEYEAKAYAALVRANPATAYEIARLSGIPTSKIYGVISRLHKKGIVMLAGDEKKKRYIPLEPSEFIESTRKKIEITLDGLENDLSSIRKGNDISYIWDIHDYEYLMEKAVRMVESAEESLLISGWDEELAVLEEHIVSRNKSNVKVAIVHFGEGTVNVGMVYQHPIEDTIYNEKGGRGIVIITDMKEALMATIYPDYKVEGAWSVNKGFVTLAEDYVKHDIYIMKIVNRFDDLLIDRFGKKYKKLRDIYNDEERE